MAHPREDGPIRLMNREKERLGGVTVKRTEQEGLREGHREDT